MTGSPTFVLVDGISEMGVHNGLSRVLLYRLGVDGEPVQTIELGLTDIAVGSLRSALMQIKESSAPAEGEESAADAA